MNLNELLSTLGSLTSRKIVSANAMGAEISDIVSDSRKVSKGCVFFAIPGHRIDGTSFISEAILKGASAIVVPDTVDLSALSTENSILDDKLIHEKAFIFVSNIREALALSGATFQKNPSKKMQCIAITGTNGKTSTAWIVSQILGHRKGNSQCSSQRSSQGSLMGGGQDSASSSSALYIGTLGAYTFSGPKTEKILDEGRTTFDPLSFQKLLAEGLSNTCTSVVSEVTSHGLEQFRTAGTEWDVAAFSNLTQDHLDYHGSMEAYGEAKSLLFFRELKKSQKKNRAAVVNIDDSFGFILAEKIKNELPEIRLLRVSEKDKNSELYLKTVNQAAQSTTFSFMYDDKEYSIKSHFLGSFYISNLLLSIGICLAAGSTVEEIVSLGEKLKAVPGRLELVSNTYPRVFVDYAHTPDALEKVQEVLLSFLRDEAERSTGDKNSLMRGKLITVFGCGGDRDRTKRPLMGRCVAELSDVAIVTSDNPRTEDPLLIIEDILPGINSVRMNRDVEYSTKVDRREAIEYALKLARKNDIILVAGKGHEDYQEIKGIKHPFDDALIVKEIISEMI